MWIIIDLSGFLYVMVYLPHKTLLHFHLPVWIDHGYRAIGIMM